MRLRNFKDRTLGDAVGEIVVCRVECKRLVSPPTDPLKELASNLVHFIIELLKFTTQLLS